MILIMFTVILDLNALLVISQKLASSCHFIFLRRVATLRIYVLMAEKAPT